MCWSRCRNRSSANTVMSETARKKELGIHPNNALCVKGETAQMEGGQ